MRTEPQYMIVSSSGVIQHGTNADEEEESIRLFMKSIQRVYADTPCWGELAKDGFKCELFDFKEQVKETI